MGHTSPAVVFPHYRELVEPEEAARYWNIRPAAAPANVETMLAATTGGGGIARNVGEGQA